MSVLTESTVTLDGSCLQCNKCRRMFAIDCTNPAVSLELLLSDAPTSKAEAIRKKLAAAKKPAGEQRQAAEPFIAGPSTVFGEVRAAPWLAASNASAARDPAQEAPLTLSTMPLTLAPHVHLSTLLGDRAKGQPLLRVDAAMLEVPQASSTVMSNLVDDGDAVGSPASLPIRLALQKLRSVPHGDDVAAPAVRPRGGQQASTTAADASQYGPYLQRALLLHAAWDLLETVSEEALINVPLCSGCWKECLVDVQHRVDAEQSLVAASQAYLHPNTESVAMCALATGGPSASVVPQQGDAQKGLLYAHLLEASGTDALDELCKLDDRLHELRTVQIELEEEDAMICEEEAIVESIRNAAELVALCGADDDDAALGARLQLRHALGFAASQCTLRELFVIELPAGCPSLGVINGVRLGKETQSTSPAQMASSASLVHSFGVTKKDRDGVPSSPRSARGGTRHFVVRDTARRTGGEPYHLFTNYAAPPVSINEINGACGHLLTALDAVVRRSGKGRLEACVLRPNGAESMIDVPIPGKKPVKYDDLKFHIVEKLFAWKTFGQAWVAFCLGLRETMEFLQGKLSTRVGLDLHDASSFPPYPIDKEGRVGGLSTKHGSVSDELWGKAVRCAMANVDWCLAAQTVIEDHTSTA